MYYLGYIGPCASIVIFLGQSGDKPTVGSLGINAVDVNRAIFSMFVILDLV
jgi:hypothetical protein